MTLNPLEERLSRHRQREILGGHPHLIGVHLGWIAVRHVALSPSRARHLKVNRAGGSAHSALILGITFDLGGFLHLGDCRPLSWFCASQIPLLLSKQLPLQHLLARYRCPKLLIVCKGAEKGIEIVRGVGCLRDVIEETTLYLASLQSHLSKASYGCK